MAKQKTNPIRGATIPVLIDILTLRGFEIRSLSPGGSKRWNKNYKYKTITLQLKRCKDGELMNFGGSTYGLALRSAVRSVISGDADNWMNINAYGFGLVPLKQEGTTVKYTP